MTRRSKGGVFNKQIVKRKKAKNDANLNEMLRMCLEKVCELQHELSKADESEEDAQAAGYAACAMEALAFLAREGLPQEHPMVLALTEKLTAGNDHANDNDADNDVDAQERGDNGSNEGNNATNRIN